MGEKLFYGRAGPDALGSTLWPPAIVSRSRTFMALRLSEGSGRGVGRKKLQHRIVELQFVFVDCDSDRGGIETLADRVQDMRLIGRVGLPPSLGDDFAVAQDHEAVEGVYVFVSGLDKIDDCL